MNLTETELDRLADYTVDVLDPEDAAEVARLIEGDPRWAAAYRSLVDADVAVRADLTALGAAAEPMPADVVTRVDAALGGLRAGSNVGSNVVSLDAARGRRRRSTVRLASAAAAAIVVLAGLGAVVQGAGQSSQSPSTEQADAGVGAQAAGPPAAAAAGPQVIASGTDYRLDSLSQLPAVTGYSAAAGEGSLKSTEVPRAAADMAGGPLSRLTGDALRVCLDAVLQRHPGTVSVLDYARYLGQPSLVIVVRQAAGSVVVAVGEDCGLSGADEKAAVPGR